MKRYELFIDESGDFTEAPTNAPRTSGRDFPSQLAGILAPEGCFTVDLATRLLRAAHDHAGLKLGDEVHGVDLRGRAFHTLVANLAGALTEHAELQAVRMVNVDRLGFGGRVPTYTNMLAELAVRLFEALAREHQGPIQLDITYALWMVDHVQVGEAEYRQRLDERLAGVMVRRGRAARGREWMVGSLRHASGRKDRRMQICDLVSNASHDGFTKCDTDSKRALVGSLRDHDFDWSVRGLSARVRDLVDEGSLGMALQAVCEAVGDEEAEDATPEANERLDAILRALAERDAASRDTQLAMVVGWLEQLVEHRGALRRGRALCAWSVERVEPALRELLGVEAQSIAPFGFELQRLALTAANHLGDLAGARHACIELDRRTREIHGRWEHSQALTEGLIRQAVHFIDCLDFSGAAARMSAVSSYYGELSELFHAALPEVFPAEVRSDARARALGTWLQAEMYAGLREPARLDVARDLSERALAQFANRDDIARQEQYRAQLESFAGRWSEARAWLARSLGAPGDDHASIAGAIRDLEGFAQGFALLHWLRIGALAGLRGERLEVDSLAAAIGKLLHSPWVTDPNADYPAHGIRRFAAVIAAASGNRADALSLLGHLRALRADPARAPAMAMTAIAAHLQVASLLWERDRDTAWQILAGKAGRPGVGQMIASLTKALPPEIDTLHRELAAWQALVVRPSDVVPARLAHAALAVPD